MIAVDIIRSIVIDFSTKYLVLALLVFWLSWNVKWKGRLLSDIFVIGVSLVCVVDRLVIWYLVHFCLLCIDCFVVILLSGEIIFVVS